jgi:hypothetical protein
MPQVTIILFSELQSSCLCVISGFYHVVKKVFAFLRCYAVLSDSWLLTFWDSLLVLASRVRQSLEEGTDRLPQNFSKQVPTLQKSKDLSWFWFIHTVFTFCHLSFKLNWHCKDWRFSFEFVWYKHFCQIMRGVCNYEQNSCFGVWCQWLWVSHKRSFEFVVWNR